MDQRLDNDASASATSLSRRSSVQASPDQVSCESRDEVVILSLRNGEYFGLNEVAARVWSLIQEPRTVAELCDVMLADYAGISAEECERQILHLLGEMAALELVTVR